MPWDKQLTLKSHMSAERQKLKLKIARHKWLLGKKSALGLDHKILTYKS